MVLSVLAGIVGRVTAANAAPHAHVAVETKDCGHSDDGCPSEDPSHEHDCPTGPHHHHCLGTMIPPLTMENPVACRLGVLSFSLIGHQQERVTFPDGPFLALDKPPLI